MMKSQQIPLIHTQEQPQWQELVSPAPTSLGSTASLRRPLPAADQLRATANTPVAVATSSSATPPAPSDPTPASCPHTLPSPFPALIQDYLRSFPDSKAKTKYPLCPPCRISRIANEIRDCQSWFRHNGGIVESTRKARLWRAGADSPKNRKYSWEHSRRRKRWVALKLRLLGWVDDYEHLLQVGVVDELAEAERWREVLREAVGIWEEEMEELTDLPCVGLEVGDTDSTIADDTSGVMEQSPEKRLTSSTTTNDVAEAIAESIPLPDTDDSDIDEDLVLAHGDWADEIVTKADGAMIRLIQNMDAKDEITLRLATESTIAHPSSLPSTPVPSRSTTPIVLKTSLRLPFSPAPGYSKLLQFSKFVMVSPPTPNGKPERRCHSFCSYIETARPRCAFKRTAKKYRRGAWASPAGYQKVETSWFTQTWLDKELDVEQVEEEEEEDEEDLDDDEDDDDDDDDDEGLVRPRSLDSEAWEGDGDDVAEIQLTISTSPTAREKS
ncbi:hypothetical protein P280DRAFT_77972 [Massarina eburnea CBS 473.64]|uniref:Uncharacterized protein n=1 Tax=Massarina eburnea CBS 473.64 TaxID=1395130 RepID=A0A6A6RUY8_9PLEO|nr:hypothetical protein P280DRAFT_77972 [Massarina eburnea CBS 473.64]